MRVAIEGLIGSGKSEALRALCEEFPSIPCFQEPVDEWGELLDLYYEDKSTWCLPFSLKVLQSFRRSNGCPISFVERSPLSCKSVFTTMLLNEGIMNQQQYDVFSSYHDIIGWVPNAIIYIDTPAATCLKRIETRGRKCEEGIDLQFMRRLEFAYETMLKQDDVRSIPVIRIDGTKRASEVAMDVIRAAHGLLSRPSN